jgi:hypothetical protein
MKWIRGRCAAGHGELGDAVSVVDYVLLWRGSAAEGPSGVGGSGTSHWRALLHESDGKCHQGGAENRG